MTVKQRITGALIVALVAVAGALGVAAPATAGSGYITCLNGNEPITNSNGSTTSHSSTTSDGTCGNVGMRAKTYVGGGAYGWSTTVYYGTGSGTHTRPYSATMNQSQHYWSYLGNPTSKILPI
jgi:hypothetical protein